MKSHPPIVITAADFQRLTSLLMSPLAAPLSPRTEALASELSRARVVPSRSIRPDLVTMNSVVEYCDESRRPSKLSLVYPWDADPRRGDISVLAPLGTALLGRHVGDTIVWKNPSGRVHRWTVLSVSFQPEALGFDHL
jgi:regulator of nucleoside diphosphate kinase